MANQSTKKDKFIDFDAYYSASNPNQSMEMKKPTTQMDFDGSKLTLGEDQPAVEPIQTIDQPAQEPIDQEPTTGTKPEESSDPNLWWLPLAGAVIGGMLEGTGAAYGGASQGAKGWAMDEERKYKEGQSQIEFDRKKELAGLKSGKTKGKEIQYQGDDGNVYWGYMQPDGSVIETQTLVPNYMQDEDKTFKVETVREKQADGSFKDVKYVVTSAGLGSKLGEDPGDKDKDSDKNIKAYKDESRVVEKIEAQVLDTNNRKTLTAYRNLKPAMELSDRNPKAAAQAIIGFAKAAGEVGVLTDRDFERYKREGGIREWLIGKAEELSKGTITSAAKEQLREALKLSHGAIMRHMKKQISGKTALYRKNFKNAYGRDFFTDDEVVDYMLSGFEIDWGEVGNTGFNKGRSPQKTRGKLLKRTATQNDDGSFIIKEEYENGEVITKDL